MKFAILSLILGALFTAALIAAPPSVQLRSFSLSRNEAPGGVIVIASVVLTRGAPKHGVDVAIQSSDSTIAQMPTVLHINQGQSSGTFQITGVPRCDQAQIDITCTLVNSQIQSLTIRHPNIQSIAFDPNPVIGGNPTIGTVTLDGPAPNCP